ncbi:hypothetical protein ACLX1H_002325 [Fusarium chlamydosporum]
MPTAPGDPMEGIINRIGQVNSKVDDTRAEVKQLSTKVDNISTKVDNVSHEVSEQLKSLKAFIREDNQQAINAIRR